MVGCSLQQASGKEGGAGRGGVHGGHGAPIRLGPDDHMPMPPGWATATHGAQIKALCWYIAHRPCRQRPACPRPASPCALAAAP